MFCGVITIRMVLRLGVSMLRTISTTAFISVRLVLIMLLGLVQGSPMHLHLPRQQMVLEQGLVTCECGAYLPWFVARKRKVPSGNV